ncbi:hypothetical protein [Microtetraspora sp. NBRC 16547]|uniref:hypothetical protein n=1 Tax=Microtetraspora sp. NBRC 16547 TaxID=3030993 RepID=UPI0024A4D6F1|nr:hypothetical protein Misp02_23610 [Microtetraspora sp. NBRC 16547]
MVVGTCPTPAVARRELTVVGAREGLAATRTQGCVGGGYSGRSYVHYGLGNFVFYNWGPETGKTGVLTLTINGRKVLKDRWTPARIDGGVPIPVTGEAGKQALAEYASLRQRTGLTARRDVHSA